MRAAVTLSGPEWLHLGVGVASVCFGTVSSFCIGRASDVCIGKQTLIWPDSPPDAAQDDAWCLSSSLEIDTRSGALAPAQPCPGQGVLSQVGKLSRPMQFELVASLKAAPFGDDPAGAFIDDLAVLIADLLLEGRLPELTLFTAPPSPPESTQ